MSKLYVPDETFLVCSNGMKMQQMKVSSQSSVMIHGKLAATIEDRTGGNFICGKMILAGAIIGAIAAIVISAAVVASGGTLVVAVGAAAAAGATAGAGLGAALAVMPCTCALLTMTTDWLPTHPKTLIEGKQALLDSSKVACVLGGQIMIFFSKEAAKEYSDLQRNRTLVDTGSVILMAYLLPTAAVGIWSAGSTYLGGISTLNATVGRKAAAAFAAEGMVYLGIGFASSKGFDYGKGKAYEKIGIDGYMTGEFEDKADKILDSPFEGTSQEGYDAFQIMDRVDDTFDGVGNPKDPKSTSYTSKVTKYEEIEYNQRTVLTTPQGSIEEVEFDKISTRTNNTIGQDKPHIETINSRDFTSSNNEVYYNEESFKGISGSQYHYLDDVKGNLGRSITAGIPDGPEVFAEVYRGISNVILESNIEDYENAKTKEAKVRAAIHVKTKEF